jgi:sensory rhodopsin
VNVLQTSDIAVGTFALAILVALAATVLLLLATGWVSGRWKLPIALSAIVMLTSGFNYFEAREVWIQSQQIPLIYHYLGWSISMPLLVAALYFFVRAMGATSVALFWRLMVVAVATVLARFMGEAGFMHPTLGFLIGLAGWLYLLGEFYFGRMGEVISKSTDESVRRGYFWLRLIVTVGWAVYPLGNFIASFAGGADAAGLAIAYNLVDLVNRAGFSLAILTVAINHSHPTPLRQGE